MKGKKNDAEFVSNFITECISSGIEFPEEIVTKAKNIIANIDNEIKNVEKQKIIRSKLLDVINAFEKPQKISKFKEINILNFCKIQEPIICKHICLLIKNKVVRIEDLKKINYNISDILFCTKQLIAYKILSYSNNLFLRGEMFNEYLNFILKGYQ